MLDIVGISVQFANDADDRRPGGSPGSAAAMVSNGQTKRKARKRTSPGMASAMLNAIWAPGRAA